MARLVEFPLEDGGSVVVEVPAGVAERPTTRGWSDRDRGVLERAEQSLEGALSRVGPTVQAMLHQLRSLADAPEQVQVEFGLQLSADVGAFVVGGSTTGNFKVSMTWRNESASSRPHAAEVGGSGNLREPT